MSFTPDPQWEWLKLLLYSVIAGIGGTLGYLMRQLDANETIKFWPTLLQGISAGFVGGIVFLLCHSFNLSDEWAGVIVGVSGWLGASASIRLLERYIFQKLGINEQVHSDVDSNSGSEK